jgi:hypothetical protein
MKKPRPSKQTPNIAAKKAPSVKSLDYMYQELLRLRKVLALAEDRLPKDHAPGLRRKAP